MQKRYFSFYIFKSENIQAIKDYYAYITFIHHNRLMNIELSQFILLNQTYPIF